MLKSATMHLPLVACAAGMLGANNQQGAFQLKFRACQIGLSYLRIKVSLIMKSV